MARFLQRVTLIERKKDGSENVSTLLRDKKRKKKKVTGWMRPTERVVNQYLKAEDQCWGNFRKRYRKSRGKKRDRWLTDGPSNALRAFDKGCRVFSRV